MHPCLLLLPLMGTIASGQTRAHTPTSKDAPATQPVQLIPTSQLGNRYELIGKLGVPLGQVVHVTGIVVKGPFKGYEGGPNLRVQRINGRATQRDIQIKLCKYFTDFGETGSNGRLMPKLKDGATYDFEGYETGGFVGVPHDAYDKAGEILQTCGHYFSTYLVVYRGDQCNPVRVAPNEFIGRRALIEGRAKNIERKAYIYGDGWRLHLAKHAPWGTDVEGKLVEAFGLVQVVDKPGDGILADSESRLVKLEDQVGRPVALRGRAWSLNGHWWFNYRGRDLYVENMEQLPDWNTECHGRWMVIEGILNEGMFPRIDQISLKPDRDKAKYFVVRSASWKPLDAPLTNDRSLDDPNP